MTAGPTVCDSSPLIALERLGQLDLLRQLFEAIFVPPAVVREMSPRLALPEGIVERQLVQPVDPRVLVTPLGDGECEAISLALEVSASHVVLDDRAARRLAQSLEVPVIGTLGIILAAKRHGLLPHIRPHLDSLVHSGFRIAPALYEQILSDAGEWP